MSNEQIPPEELERIDQDAARQFPDWTTDFDQGQLFHVYVRGARAEYLRHLSGKPSTQGVTGIEWVKASERKPAVRKSVWIKHARAGHYEQTGGWYHEDGYWIIYTIGTEKDHNRIEWLDEATPTLLEAKTETTKTPNWWEDAKIISEVTAVMRAADVKFETSGGGTGHYVRDLLLPMFDDAGLKIISKDSEATVEPAAETEKETGYVNSDRYIPMTSGDPDKSDAYLRKLVREAHNRETELMKKAIVMRDCYNNYISVLLRSDRTIEMSATQREALCEALKPFDSILPSLPSVQQEAIPDLFLEWLDEMLAESEKKRKETTHAYRLLTLRRVRERYLSLHTQPSPTVQEGLEPKIEEIGMEELWKEFSHVLTPEELAGWDSRSKVLHKGPFSYLFEKVSKAIAQYCEDKRALQSQLYNSRREAQEYRKALRILEEGYSDNWTLYISKHIREILDKYPTPQTPTNEINPDFNPPYAIRTDGPASTVLVDALANLYKGFNLPMLGEHTPRFRTLLNELVYGLRRVDRHVHHRKEEKTELEALKKERDDYRQMLEDIKPNYLRIDIEKLLRKYTPQAPNNE